MIFWKKEVDFSVDTYSPNHIDAIINKGKEGEWRFTGFYGEFETSNHYISWATLRRLKQNLHYLGYVRRTLTKLSEPMSNWGET